MGTVHRHMGSLIQCTAMLLPLTGNLKVYTIALVSNTTDPDEAYRMGLEELQKTYPDWVHHVETWPFQLTCSSEDFQVDVLPYQAKEDVFVPYTWD